MLAEYLKLIDTPESQSEFEWFYYKYRKLMYYIALDIVKDKHLSEDVVSETFMNLAKNFEFIKTLGEIECPQIKRYVVISVRNTALNMRKKEKRYKEFFLDETELAVMEYEQGVDDGILDVIIENEALDKIKSILSKLPEIYKETMQLYIVCDYDANQVAKALGIKKVTVYKRIQRARMMIETGLKEY